MTKMVHEVLALVAAATSNQKKIEILRANDSLVLKTILVGTFDDRVIWDLPPGTPPYTPTDPKSIPSSLSKNLPNLQYFVAKGPGKDMLKLKREMKFIHLLESIDQNDALVVLAMIAKQPPVGLTKPLVQEAFPNLIPN